LRVIEADLRNGYVLAYKPSRMKADGKFHALKVKVPGSAVVVTVRSGYFAPAPEQDKP
jgi:hypothetical protein